MRRVHDHHDRGCRIGPCDCADPQAPGPPGYPRRDRPPPTGYLDEQGAFHPGPGCEGYRAHLPACWSCCRGVLKARDAGDAWAMATMLPEQLPPVPMPIAGPGMPREQQELLRLRPQHIGPCAVVVGAVSYAVTALLSWWLAAPALAALLALLVVLGERIEIDRLPPARLLERSTDYTSDGEALDRTDHHPRRAWVPPGQPAMRV